MLDNLKLVLLQHKRFLAIFFFIVFLPSIILAVFGIRAIQNERYKLRHQTREQQVEYVETFQDEVLLLIERSSSSLRDISFSQAFIAQDYPAIQDLISQRSLEQSLIGHAVIWNRGESPWLPGQQGHPSNARPFIIPSEWHTFLPELAWAEEAEFRRRDHSQAVSLYSRILRRARDNQVKAWSQSRIARCEAKQEKFKQALITYRSILAEFPELHTESGRPLGLVTRLQILDALRSDNDYAAFFQESLEIYKQLDQNAWSLDGDQLGLYANMLKAQIDEVVAEDSPPSPKEGLSHSAPQDLPQRAPADYAASVENSRDAIEAKLAIWHMARSVQNSILPELKDRLDASTNSNPPIPIHRDSIVVDGIVALALILPIPDSRSGQFEGFLGSLILDSEIVNALDPKITEKRPPGVSLTLRSTRTGRILYGGTTPKASSEAAAETSSEAATTPVLEDFFPENFPPWKVEIYEAENLSAAPFLYKNIFFWTILALLVILFLGSGLIIRTMVHEVNLLNLKSEFIASVSHEFKTPLTAMGAILERLLDDEVKDPQKAREYYKILSHDSERLKRLVKNVLDFTKMEEGKRRYRLAPLNIVRLVHREVESFEKENKIVGFTVAVAVADDIPLVSADEEAMSQALHNILDNAAKFSLQEKNIDLEVVRTKDTVEISVRDSGIGIPESEQWKIFEKFFRGKQASTVSPTGTGLGLTLVKHIMTAHGGDVSIQSKPGKGSRVSLILPIREGG